MLLLYRGSAAASGERGAGKIGEREKGKGAGEARVKGEMSLWNITPCQSMTVI